MMTPEPTVMNRRAVLGTIGALGAAAMLPRAAAARSLRPQPAAGKSVGEVHGAGFYSFPVGELKLSLLSDGMFPLAPSHPLFGANASKSEVDAAFQGEFVDPEKVMGHVNVLLIPTAKGNVLVDTGCGKLFGDGTGKVPAALGRLGVSLESITAIILTHAHGDHYGGALHDDGSPVFPKAKIYASKTEHDGWKSGEVYAAGAHMPKDRQAQMIEGARGFFDKAKGRLELVKEGDEIAPGVRMIPLPGHTVGHFAVHVSSGKDQLIYVADAVHHHAIGFPKPDWHVMFDSNPDQAAQSRRKILGQAAADRILIAGSHLPFPAVGHVRADGKSAFQWVPVVWQW